MNVLLRRCLFCGMTVCMTVLMTGCHESGSTSGVSLILSGVIDLVLGILKLV